jgi:ABC-type spermidine/putrescine transport system permease subunit I
MNTRWEYLLVPSFVVSFVLLAASQLTFLRGSLSADMGLGNLSKAMGWGNYQTLFTDEFYLRSLWLTVKVSAIATVCTLLMSFPVAYVIARMRSRWAMVMLAGVVVSSFVTIVIKVYGLIVIFSADGGFNKLMMAIGLLDRPYTIIGNPTGVVVGLMQFTMGFAVLLLYSVVRTIPTSLEEAATVHGASRPRVFWRVILPLSLPGVIVGALMMFNMCMGAFTSASLLGGGRVFTLPVLIQRAVIVETKYGMGATLAAVLLVSVILINVVSVFLVRRLRAAKLVIA